MKKKKHLTLSDHAGEYVTACESTQQLGGGGGGGVLRPPRKLLIDALRSLLGPFLDPSLALSAGLGRLGF